MRIAIIVLLAFCCVLSAASIGGRVTDSYGIPVVGFSVVLTEIGTFPPPPPEIEVTNVWGEYSFSGLLAGIFSITPGDPTGVTPISYPAVTVVSDLDSLTGYDFIRSSGTTFDALIRGTVTYEFGGPASGVNIMSIGMGGGGPWTVMTDTAGEYSLAVPAPESIYVMCAAPGGLISSPDFHAFPVLAGDTIAGVDFILLADVLDTFFSITAIITDSSGSPFDALVQYRDIIPTSPWLAEYTSSGIVTFYLDGPGDYIVQPMEDGYYFVPEADTITITTSAPAVVTYFTAMDSSAASPYWIHIEARDSTYSAVDSIFIEWVRDGGSIWTPGWTIDGEYSAHVPDSGLYSIRAATFLPGMIVVPAETSLHLTATSPEDTLLVYLIADTTSIAETTLPSQIEMTAYPNPFNGNCRLMIDDLRLGIDAIEVFDVNGRSVNVIARRAEPDAAISSLTEKDYRALRARNDGVSEFIWTPAASLGSGVYLVRVTIHDDKGLQPLVQTKRIVYLK